jgi:hypothetical protein
MKVFKKVLMVVAVVAFTVSVAKADLIISWQASGGFYFGLSDPGVGILGDGTGFSTYAQLIFSTDATRDLAVADGGANDYLGGDDILLGDFTITEDGIANDGVQFDSYAWMNSQSYNGTFQSGYVYARFFQDSSIDANDYYYATALVATEDRTAIQGPQSINANSGFTPNSIDNSSGVLGDSFQVQPVPEPGTLMLIAMGLATVGLSRKRKRA